MITDHHSNNFFFLFLSLLRSNSVSVCFSFSEIRNLFGNPKLSLSHANRFGIPKSEIRNINSTGTYLLLPHETQNVAVRRFDESPRRATMEHVLVRSIHVQKGSVAIGWLGRWTGDSELRLFSRARESLTSRWRTTACCESSQRDHS